MGTERPNISPLVMPSHAWRHARENVTMVPRTWRMAVFAAAVTALPGVLMPLVLGSGAEAKVQAYIVAAAWGSWLLIAGAETVWRRIQAPSEIRADRLRTASKIIDEQARELAKYNSPDVRFQALTYAYQNVAHTVFTYALVNTTGERGLMYAAASGNWAYIKSDVFPHLNDEQRKELKTAYFDEHAWKHTNNVENDTHESRKALQAVERILAGLVGRERYAQ